MSVAITKPLNYSTKSSAPRARRYTRVLPSLGNNPSSGYGFGDEIQWFVPCGLANQVFDGRTASLQFTLHVEIDADGGNIPANTMKVAWDYQAGSAINRLDTYGSGGQLLESISRYSALTNLLYDLELSQNELQGLSSMIGSWDGDTKAEHNRVGKDLVGGHAEIVDGQGIECDWTFSIPLVSSIFALSEKYFPAYLAGDDMKIQILLNTLKDALVITDHPDAVITASIRNPHLVIDYLELEPAAIEQMNGVFGGGEVILHSSSYHTYETTLADQTNGTWNSILPCKAMSVKALFSIFRNLGVTSVINGYTQSVRTNPFTGSGSSFSYSVGGERHPHRPLQTVVDESVSEYFTELTKAIHSYGDLLANGCLTRKCFESSRTVVVADTPDKRGFAIGMNLSALHGADDVVLSGLDLSKVTTYLEGNVTQPVVGNQTVNTFALHDVLIVIDSNGMMSAKW